MRAALARLLFAAALVPALATTAGAVAVPGDVAPNFTKNQLDSPSFGLTTPRSLSDYLGKVVVLFVLGYS